MFILFVVASNRLGPTDRVYLVSVESIILVDEYFPKRNEEDDEVIFIRATPAEQRITAVVDLCTSDTDTPNRPARRSRHAQTSTSHDRSSSLPALSPERPATSKRDIPQIQCPICLDDFPLNQMWTTLCGHGFCEPCIRNCIQTRKKCPTCNTKCTIKQIHRLFIQ